MLFISGCALTPHPPRAVPPEGVAKRSARMVIDRKSVELDSAARGEFLQALDRELFGTGQRYLNAFKRGNDFTVRCEITRYVPYGTPRASQSGYLEYEDEIDVAVKVFDARGKLVNKASCTGYGHHARGPVVIRNNPAETSAPASVAESAARLAVWAAYGKGVAYGR